MWKPESLDQSIIAFLSCEGSRQLEIAHKPHGIAQVRMSYPQLWDTISADRCVAVLTSSDADGIEQVAWQQSMHAERSTNMWHSQAVHERRGPHLGHQHFAVNAALMLGLPFTPTRPAS